MKKEEIVINGITNATGYEVTTNAYKQTLYFVFWDDLVKFISRTIAYDFTIKSGVKIPDNAKELDWPEIQHIWAV